MENFNNIWDVHHHWVAEEGYIDRLLREMDRLGVEKTGLIVMGPLLRDLFVQNTGCEMATHEEVVEVVQKHPDRFWGYGYIRPGHSPLEDVDRYHEMGIPALKFHMSAKPYGDEEYFPIYARANELKMPCLFHTGIFYPPHQMPGEGIRSENYRPLHLEPIAHEFPDLKIIIAHLGVIWNKEAATLCRMFPNIFADLSGRVDGWRSAMPVEKFGQLLYWPDAYKKILFGSDVHADEMEETIDHQHWLLKEIGWDESKIKAVFTDNAKALFS